MKPPDEISPQLLEYRPPRAEWKAATVSDIFTGVRRLIVAMILGGMAAYLFWRATWQDPVRSAAMGALLSLLAIRGGFRAWSLFSAQRIERDDDVDGAAALLEQVEDDRGPEDLE